MFADAKTAYGIENWKSILYGREVHCGFLNTKITVLTKKVSRLQIDNYLVDI